MEAQPEPLEIEVEDLKQRLDANEAIVVLDVREPWELEIARLEGTLDIPMGSVMDRLDDLPHDKPIAVLCRSGRRSLEVTHFLRQKGYQNASNVAGGILAWASRLDDTMSKY